MWNGRIPFTLTLRFCAAGLQASLFFITTTINCIVCCMHKPTFLVKGEECLVLFVFKHIEGKVSWFCPDQNLLVFIPFVFFLEVGIAWKGAFPISHFSTLSKICKIPCKSQRRFFSILWCSYCQICWCIHLYPDCSICMNRCDSALSSEIRT